MASIIKKLVENLNLSRREDLIFGRINDIFVNLKFIEHTKNESNANLIEFLMQPKYDCLTVNVYAAKKEPVNIRELSDFLELHYTDYRTSLPSYYNGRFFVSLYPHDTLNMKVSHVIAFLNLLTDFLSRQGYFSNCMICGGQNSISPVFSSGIMLEMCVNCQLKDANL